MLFTITKSTSHTEYFYTGIFKPIINKLIIKYNKSISKDMAFGKNNIVRSHYIFSLADSLAMAIIDSDVVLTGIARLRYKKPVYSGQLLVAKARIATKKSNKYLVSVHIKCNHKEVFTAKLIMVSLEQKSNNSTFNIDNQKIKEF